MNKQDIRKENLKKRRLLQNREEKDKAILERFLSLTQYKTAKTVMTYLSYKSEPDTLALAEKMIQDGKTVCAPVCGEHGQMDSFAFSDLSLLHRSSMGIWEPPEDRLIPPEDIDLIIVPGCAFTKNGYRLGYGGGYYDRYLPKTHAFTCGFFYEALKREFPSEETDVPLHAAITEEQIYLFI